MLNSHLHIWDAVWADEARDIVPPSDKTTTGSKTGVDKPGRKKGPNVHNTPAN